MESIYDIGVVLVPTSWGYTYIEVLAEYLLPGSSSSGGIGSVEHKITPPSYEINSYFLKCQSSDGL